MNDRTSQLDAWFAIIASILVLFTAMLDTRVSAVLAIVMLVGFAGVRYMQSRV
jgi:hypothetical protein